SIPATCSTGVAPMARMSKLVRPLALALLVSSLGGCAVGVGRPYYPYEYPWYYTRYGTYTVVRRPVIVVDDWTTRAFRYRPYRGYVVRRHNSPVVEYAATKGNATIEVNLIPLGDSTQVEVRARRGAENWDQEQARAMMGHILREYNK
ncbi:MAG: hypothetical protein ACREMA_05440, partial [Longimicrobiales bacterium]